MKLFVGFTIPNILMCKWHCDSELVKALNEAIPNACLAVHKDCDRLHEQLRIMPQLYYNYIQKVVKKH